MRALSTFRNLTGGRLPPLTRTALLCGLAVFLLALLVFHPGAGGEAPAQPLSGGVKLVAPGDAATESVVLLDTSAVYFPAKSGLGGAGRSELGQPEDTPFARFAPVLQFNPSKAPAEDSSLRLPRRDVPTPAQAVSLAETDPFATFGSKGYQGQGIEPRCAFFEVLPINGGSKALISGKITHFNDKNGLRDDNIQKNNPFNSNFEVILSVDSLGKSPLGGVVRLTGSKPLDEAVRRWAMGMDWASQLPPGAYRLIVGP